eukprot:6173934-Pleurochrysis_carterae.AAC.1
MEPEKDAEDNHTQDTRRVFLVRHAESEQNVAAHRLAARGEISALLSLLSIGFDSPLSGPIARAPESLEKTERLAE